MHRSLCALLVLLLPALAAAEVKQGTPDGAIIEHRFRIAATPAVAWETLVHPERYTKDLETAYPAPGTWSAVPFPSSIGLYQAGQGSPRFDKGKADEYYAKVAEKIQALIMDVVKKWDAAGLH